MANFAIRMLGQDLPEITLKELKKLAKNDTGYLLWASTLSNEDRKVKAISINTLKEFLGISSDDGR